MLSVLTTTCYYTWSRTMLIQTIDVDGEWILYIWEQGLVLNKSISEYDIKSVP